MRNEYIVENSSDGIFAFDVSSQLTTYNKALRNFTGVDKGIGIGENLFETIGFLINHISPLDIETVLQGKVVTKKSVVYFDNVDRQYIRFNLELSPILDDQDDIIGGVGLVSFIERYNEVGTHNQDIIKPNDVSLLESEKRYRDLIEYSPLAITVHSEGKIVFANEQSGKLLDVDSPQDLIGKDLMHFVPQDQRDSVRKKILAIHKNGRTAPMIEETFITDKGKEITAEVVGIPYKFEGKRAVQIIARDVTEKKATESVLKRSEILLSQLFKNVPIGIVQLDDKRRVIQVNKGFENIFGYDNKEVFGQKLNDLIIPKESRGESINITALIAGGDIVKEVEAFRKTKSGEMIPVMIYGVPVKLKDEIIAIYGIYVDIRASKKVEEELKVRNEELDNFVYKVSHDLRAPLSSTLGLIHLAKLEGNDADLKQYIDLIGSRISQLDRFIADVLSHSKNLHQDVNTEEIDFNKIIESSFEELNYLPCAETISRKVTISDHRFVNDHWRISEILRNLISNSIKYLNPELDEPYIKIDIDIDDKRAEIVFEDNGIGIAKDLQPRIFDMFFRATDFSEGSGIGLYIVKNAIDKIGGTIRLESTQYKDAKFYISIPNK